MTIHFFKKLCTYFATVEQYIGVRGLFSRYKITSCTYQRNGCCQFIIIWWQGFHLAQICHKNKTQKYFSINHFDKIPVCTLSPTWSSDIVIDFPFSGVSLAVPGKQFLHFLQRWWPATSLFHSVPHLQPHALHTFLRSLPEYITPHPQHSQSWQSPPQGQTVQVHPCRWSALCLHTQLWRHDWNISQISC